MPATLDPPAASAATARQTSVAVIDDHPLVRRGLIELLAETEDLHFIGEATDRATGLELLRENAADVALVDLSLGDSSGLELLKDIVGQYGKVTKALVLSMHDESLFAHRCLEAGASGYISKQQHPDEILKAIRTVANDELYLSTAISNDLLGRVVGRQSVDRGGFVSMLTDREYQVFEALGKGLTVREIAAQLFISRKTVENHRDRIKAKLGLGTANELLRHAVAWNLGASAISGASV